MVTRNVSFNWKDASGVSQSYSIGFATAVDRLILRDIFVNGDISVREIKFNKSANQLYLVDKDGKDLPIRK